MTRIALHHGDCLDVLDTLPADSVHAVVTDPPYHLTSIVKRFGAASSAAARCGTEVHHTGAYVRASKGFMGQEWDGGDIAFRPETWTKLLRVLVPGGHLIAFNHSRTYHHMAVAIEAAGFEMRDSLIWIYGSGFPKSHDVSKSIDKMAGAEREVLAQVSLKDGESRNCMAGGFSGNRQITRPATSDAAAWEGWGTALKPAFEPICLARKPLVEPSIARQCLSTGTGALNIDAARIPGLKPQVTQGVNANPTSFVVARNRRISSDPTEGRWPANILHDGSPEAVRGMPVDPVSGEAAQSYFYCAKADKADRRGSDHPTVKPQSLMRWLVRLVTREGQTVLDPFAGSGATGWAAATEGRRAILIEREDRFADHIRALIDRQTERPQAPAPSDDSPQARLF